MSVMTTHTGKKIDPSNMSPDDIDIMDIAHHLSTVNRFGGAADPPVSVAQHSVWVATVCEKKCGLMSDGRTTNTLLAQALLHDAAEAYMGDVVKWLKASSMFDEYRAVERQLERAIWKKFGLPEDMLPQVEEADRLCVRFEASRVMPRMHTPEEWQASYPPVTSEEEKLFELWAPWEWRHARSVFQNWAQQLGLIL